MSLFEPPPHASRHCRYYSWNGGAQCGAGLNISAPKAALPCMPLEASQGERCDWREEYTDEERAARQRWLDERAGRMRQIRPLIPGNSTDRTKRPEWGKSGSFDCPACGAGKVRWARAAVNGHLHAGCTTPGCFSVMQ